MYAIYYLFYSHHVIWEVTKLKFLSVGLTTTSFTYCMVKQWSRIFCTGQTGINRRWWWWGVLVVLLLGSSFDPVKLEVRSFTTKFSLLYFMCVFMYFCIFVFSCKE